MLYGQKQAMQWHFGSHQSLDFNYSPPKTAISPIETPEGCSSVSDYNGNLLFFTDGRTVWNKNLEVMVNGELLYSHPSSTQAALIVPQPGSCNLYYVFSQNAVENGLLGLFYSVVDVSLQSGLGEVTTKNVLLYPYSTEKLTASVHQNGHDYWIISHRFPSDEFVAYQLSSSGLDPDPVISAIGTVHAGGAFFDDFLSGNAIGNMKTSPDGRKIAVAIGRMSRYEVADFDPATGKVSNLITLQLDLHDPLLSAYGVEFSPDGNLLYVSISNGESGYNRVLQFNLLAGIANAIVQSVVTVASSSFRKYWGIQLGPDYRIYVVSYGLPGLDVINNPNAVGLACDYVSNSIPLYFTDGMQLGLPNFPSGYFHRPALGITAPQSVWLGADTIMCPGQTLLLEPKLAGMRYQWQDGSTASSFRVNKPGKYWVTASNLCGYTQDTIEVKYTDLPPINLGADQLVCGQPSTILTAPAGFERYHWNTGSTDNNLLVESTGNYWVEGYEGQCVSRSNAVHIQFVILPALELGSDTTLCDDESLTLLAPSGFDSFLWNDGSTEQQLTVTQSGMYWIKAIRQSCLSIDSIQVTFEECPIFIPNVVTPNGDGQNDIFRVKGIGENWHLEVYNRYGTLLYREETYNQRWDAPGLPDGTYFYHLTHPKRLRSYKGWLSVLK